MAKPENWGQMTPEEKRAWRLENFSKSGDNVQFVNPKAKENFNVRIKRLIDAYNIQEPDRVPLNITTGNNAIKMAGLTMGDAFYHPEKAMEAAKKFNEQYAEELESYAMPFAISGEALDKLDYKLYAWPGHGLPREAAGWQFIEGEYMTVDEYDELILDPSDFWIRKYFPRVFGVFEPMGMFQPFTNITENVHIAHLMPLATEPVQDMLRRLLEIGDMFKKSGVSMGRFSGMSGASYGFPTTFGGFAKAPFDTLGDTLRGTTNIMKDMYRRPDKVLKALDVIADITIQNTLKSPNIDNIFLITYPLHKGADGWMSQKQFDTFYWPSLKKVMDAFIEEGLIQSMFAEGSFNTRLDYIDVFPKGSVVWYFDATDMEKAKKSVGKNCCIMGNLPASLLVTSGPEENAAYAKKLIDICAPGGGYIMCPGSSPENPKMENIKAIVDTVNRYGYYK